LNIVKIKAQEYKLDKIRKQFLAHKNIDSSGDPNVRYLNFISSIHFNHTEEILIDLNNINSEFFNIPVNNSFELLYQNSHKMLFDFLNS
jgi:hypothetical protein